MTAKKSVKVTKTLEKETPKPTAMKVAAKPVPKKVPVAAKKATPAKKVTKPMNTVTLGTQTKKKVDQTSKTELKITELRSGLGSLYGRPT